MTFVKMASSSEEVYEVKESHEDVLRMIRADSQPRAFVTFTAPIDGMTGLNELVSLNVDRIEAVWPS